MTSNMERHFWTREIRKVNGFPIDLLHIASGTVIQCVYEAYPVETCLERRNSEDSCFRIVFILPIGLGSYARICVNVCSKFAVICNAVSLLA